MTGPRIREILKTATQRLKDADVSSARIETEAFIAECLNINRAQLIFKLEERIAQADEKRIIHCIERREKGEPFFYILGKREFWSLDFKVNPHVLSPRPETEILLERFLEIAGNRKEDSIRLLDVGAGSGCISICAALELETLRATAVDISEEALNVAKENARIHKVEDKIQFFRSDLFPPGEGEQFHFILSNPPYIASDDLPGLPSDIRDHEPHLALDGGRDGLDFYRRIIAKAKSRLSPGGFLILEIGETQARAIAGIADDEGEYESPLIYKDYAGKDRVISIKKKESHG